MTVYGTIAAGNTINVRLVDKAKAKTVSGKLADGNRGFRFRFISCTHIPLVGWEYSFAVIAKGEEAS